MNRREFLKLVRDATVAIPALGVAGYSEPQPTMEQVCELKPFYVTGGSVEWSNAHWGTITNGGTGGYIDMMEYRIGDEHSHR